MSADLDGGAAPASLDDLVVAEPAQAAGNGGAAPDAVSDTENAADVEAQPEAEDAGPAPEE
ncbi:hypothetical protein SK854_35560 [Lentzea sp. BCCO 10_0061]|uniref:Uncharacterized protein n=1 Tax=Lentzea sokolovensis TaxID=3095429 RepID=A0ABU4V6V4_9PSEU|nr:hypothetical protein [Lentzea sp. BCCO 10_0061]MDX8147474.1 hypothetical protein [Lentzea sp. BCCO 10_0061]